MEEQAQGSIKDRIARMNLEEVHAPTPGARPSYTFEHAPAKKRPPPPPPRPHVQQRQQTVNNPPIFVHAHTTDSTCQSANLPIEAPLPAPRLSPALPPRPPPRSNTQQSPALPPRRSPALPPRRPSGHSLQRKGSNESVSTIASGISAYSLNSNGDNKYTVRAPVYDPSTLPVLPPKKASEPPKRDSATLRAMRSTSSDRPDKRVLPPVLPSRPTAPVPERQESKTQAYLRPQRSTTSFPSPRLSALSQGLNPSTEVPPPIPGRPSSKNVAFQSSAPPPIPMASRPNLEAIMASKPKPLAATHSCLKCRDFSGPDAHASRFPRDSVPSSDVGWLAVQLTSPFPSATNKARAIFTWLHHNVDYDTHSFFGGTVSNTTPERTLRSGLAVCSGYAGLFSALALKAGLECIVVSGDGKGFGHTPLKPGDPLPPMKSNHAWNAVRIDDGEWKLIDACWGAGNVQGPTEPYQPDFKPHLFTMDNNEFGLKHFPMDNAHFFRTDGRACITWEEYIMNDVEPRVTVWSNATPEHAIGEQTVLPATKELKVFDPHASPDVRFQFSYICPHWDNERMGKGKPYVMVLHVGGRDGRKSDYIPFEFDGKTWWLDWDRTQLGAPGQKVSVFAVNSFDGRDARGLTYSEYRTKKGRVAMGFAGIAMWELV